MWSYRHFEPSLRGNICHKSIKARGIIIQRWRVRERLNEVDAVGRAMKRRRTIQRRVYDTVQRRVYDVTVTNQL